MCKEHEEPLKMFCFTCDRLICRDCTIIDHSRSEHQYEFIKKAAPETKKMLIQQLEPLKEMKANLSRAVEEVQTTKSEIMARGDSVANEIKKSCEELMIIENYTQELLREAEMKVKQKLKNLSDQEEELSADCDVITSVIEHTQQSVEQSTEEKILCTQAEHEKQIKKEIEEHCKKGRSLNPVEEVDMVVEMSFADGLKETKPKVIQLPIDPAKCIVSGDGMKTAEINEMAELTLKTKLSNGQSTKRKYAVECHLKSLVNGSIVKCIVDLIGGNEYCIRYTPVIRGRHELTVIVNEQEVAGSPFPVFVSIHPSKLGKPVSVIQIQSDPLYIAVNSVGEVIVAGGSYIEVFDRKGVKLRSMNPSDYRLNRACGVAVDSTNKTVYIIGDYGKPIIVKLSEDMNLLKKIHSELDSSRFCGMVIVGDEVMVCDSKNNCIHVYTTELQYVRKIGSHGDAPGKFNQIYDISSDENGNLYVGDYKNSYIQVFSNGGEFLHSFCSDDPCGVSVAGQYAYVVNYKSNNISVFTTMGEYVTSFGQIAPFNKTYYKVLASTSINYFPWGVCVDQDGFVHVCDQWMKRIQIF